MAASSLRYPREAWDFMLPGPASRGNGGCCDCSSSGLLAYGAGSSVAIVDIRSTQLVSVLPMPAPSSSPLSLSPFVTSLRWAPHPLRPDPTSDPSISHLRLAIGDRHGRIALCDLRSRQILLWFDSDPKPPSSSSGAGIQDLCWILSAHSFFLLASISGPSLLSLWNPSSGRCIWKYDAYPEYLSCIRRDPFDSRHLCALGLRGFLLSAKVLGDRDEDDVSIREHQIPATHNDSFLEQHKLEKEAAANTAAPFAPALAAFPTFFVRFGFSLQWRHILFVTFPRELVVFDLQYGTALSSMGFPRGCAKFMDVVPDLDNDLIYCAHLDGKLSIWKRKEGEQVHVLCTMEELMPSIGTTVPCPSILAVVACQSESALQNVAKLYSDTPHTSSAAMYATPDVHGELQPISETHLISISDDGKIWSWLLTVDGNRHFQKTLSHFNMAADVSKVTVPETHIKSVDSSEDRPKLDTIYEFDHTVGTCSRPSNTAVTRLEMSFKINLVGQLHLLSSTVTMLAVPSPSLTATLARGGNNPAVAVPLVALGTQSGTIDVIDVSANAVAASFSVHNSIVRGLRWLGNSRLVSFSYVQVNDKGGGYTNKLIVSCLRSGRNCTFRVLQKPERVPIRALRASPSGRYLLVLFRDAPVEVWAMTKNPIMIISSTIHSIGVDTSICTSANSKNSI